MKTIKRLAPLIFATVIGLSSCSKWIKDRAGSIVEAAINSEIQHSNNYLGIYTVNIT